MIRRPPRSTRTDTLFPYTTLFRSNVAIHHGTVTGMLAAVRSGFGLAVLPSFIADRDPDLVRCLPPLEGDPASLWLLTHERLRHTPRVRVVMAFLGERLTRLAREKPAEVAAQS